jgi:hypothetical protein
MWTQLMGAGLSLGKSLSDGKAKRDDIKANNSLSRFKASMENKVRQGKNTAAAAEANLGRVAQSISNQRRARAAGENVARAGEAIAKAQDAASANSFAASVRGAEELGAITAQAAFSGVLGGSADTLANTSALRQAMQEELAERQARQKTTEMARAGGEFARSGIQGLDTRVIMDNRDVGQSVAKEQPVTGSVLTDILNSKTDWRGLADGAAEAGKSAYAWWKGGSGGYDNTNAENAKLLRQQQSSASGPYFI